MASCLGTSPAMWPASGGHLPVSASAREERDFELNFQEATAGSQSKNERGMQECVREEIEAVQAVYCDDLEEEPDFDAAGGQVCALRLRIRPDTAGNDVAVHASCSLRVSLNSGYPTSEPALVDIQSCVGMSNEDVSALRGALAAAGAEMLGDCSLFHILQTAKDFVNSRNTPSDDCCICMCAFDPDENFLKTACGHCFHVPCVARWVHDQHLLVLESAQRDKKASPAKAPTREVCGEDLDCLQDPGQATFEVQEAKCPICRSEIGSDRLAVLHLELQQLHVAHLSEAARAQQQEQALSAAKAAELEARKRQERAQREQREKEAFDLQPVLVIDDYCENIKVLRHQMAPLGASECRIMGKQKAVSLFATLEKASRACDSLRARFPGNSIRIATFDDHRSLNLGSLVGSASKASEREKEALLADDSGTPPVAAGRATALASSEDEVRRSGDAVGERGGGEGSGMGRGASRGGRGKGANGDRGRGRGCAQSGGSARGRGDGEGGTGQGRGQGRVVEEVPGREAGRAEGRHTFLSEHGSQDGGVLFALHVKPGAKQTQVMNAKAIRACNASAVDVQIAAPPRDGEANDAVLQFVADICAVRKKCVSLVNGHKSRDKVCLVDTKDIIGANDPAGLSGAPAEGSCALLLSRILTMLKDFE